MRLSTRCKIWFTLGLFANYFSLELLSLSLKVTWMCSKVNWIVERQVYCLIWIINLLMGASLLALAKSIYYEFPKGRTIRKVMGGGGGIFEPQEFSFVIKFLVWIFFRPYHECFLGLIGMHEFFSFNFPLREYFFCTSLLCLLISMLTDWKKAINAKNIDRS